MVIPDTIQILVSIIIVSIFSLSGIYALSLSDTTLNKILFVIIGFSRELERAT